MKTIKLMADYFCSPLWKADPMEVGNIDPDSLPISQNLKEMLSAWAAEYDKTLDMDDPSKSGFKSEHEELAFKEIGANLANLLREELGPNYIVKMQLE